MVIIWQQDYLTKAIALALTYKLMDFDQQTRENIGTSLHTSEIEHHWHHCVQAESSVGRHDQGGARNKTRVFLRLFSILVLWAVVPMVLSCCERELLLISVGGETWRGKRRVYNPRVPPNKNRHMIILHWRKKWHFLVFYTPCYLATTEPANQL